MRPHSEFIILIEKVLRPVHHLSYQYGETRGSLIQKENGFFLSIEKIRDFLELRADHAAQGENVALSRLSEAEYQTKLLLQEQKSHLLSEARSELDMQELR